LKVRFLLDENLPPRLKTALLRLNPQIDVLRVGEPSAPSTGTLDPEILIYLEVSQRLLVTDNRSSMPKHLTDHWDTGSHIWGLLWIRPDTPVGKLAQVYC
jgi:predicted nuclease of predicted toxin-antitoxin system